MKNRINARETNLAKVSEDKALDDVFNTEGFFYKYAFFDKAMRKAHKIDLAQGRWVYDESREKVADKTYMYAVGPNGALYIGTPTVHSQFKAGKETQSAGWLDYFWDETTGKKEVAIDNCSGHYTPTLSQFLSTVHGLCQEEVLPSSFQIKLSKFTQFDYQNEFEELFKKAKEESSNTEKSTAMSVKYNSETKALSFSLNTQTMTLSEEQIKAKNNAMALKPSH
ncbi:hypothetical protein DIZ81_05585 [Legionella taurinensis]|uniref:Uncharacterized protein n=1 Tax=Legionella taurinensis TaxID=70611 RepID=A0A3A5L8P3_9GAMM|nr:hypothetical protein [Legionella taurinensis]MDX1837385.1 hypothetical protein [Legionella taurinensis]PUT40736.1 hypothetical protein DB744_05585 [Legionella taurinensis]PUT44158.1 hypothetical protein DB746_03985 [Legionella taurinensis]PUT47459.1 hypothetical protein DB743_02155 [Legionella taurinensis]PUT48598.1 hypothetical protein DB745_03985 [Legionella taurinensis]